MTSIRLLFGIAILTLLGSAHAANRPAGYVTICNEGKTCSVATPTKVAFGRANKFIYQTLVGSFVCSEATFGGRIAGGVNECSVPKGGSGSSSSSSSSSSSGGPVITGASCVSTGSVIVTTTIQVNAGETFDGACKTFVPGPYLQGPSNDAWPLMFAVKDGATLKNVILDTSAGNSVEGISIVGNATLDNVALQGPKFITGFKTGLTGNVQITNVSMSSFEGSPFLFSGNGSKLSVTNMLFNIARTGPVFRQRGGTTFKSDVACDRCSILSARNAIFQTDSPTSTAQLTNSVIPAGLPVCAGYASGNCVSSNVTTQ